MNEAITLFRHLYRQHGCIEVCIAELKRKGFAQPVTVRAFMVVSGTNMVKADEVVASSLACS